MKVSLRPADKSLNGPAQVLKSPGFDVGLLGSVIIEILTSDNQLKCYMVKLESLNLGLHSLNRNQ